MADFECHSSVRKAWLLWTKLNKVAATQYAADDYESIDEALRNWLEVAPECREEFSRFEELSPFEESAQFEDFFQSDEFVESEESSLPQTIPQFVGFFRTKDVVALCSQYLLEGELFRTNPEYVRMQIIHSLLQEDDTGRLFVIAKFLLLAGRQEESSFGSMIGECCFDRLRELIHGRKENDPALHRVLLVLMYEMSRAQHLRVEDLLHVEDDFVTYLFQLIEMLSDDADDPCHEPIIHVLLVLNEQYMLLSTTPSTDPTSPTAPLTNRVVKCLSLYGSHYRTFGENIILLLNRARQTSEQLLFLKLLYLLFTTKATHEYFYTNDLRVLLDVIIRNLLDLPDESMSLRHTYLRVLAPLLAHTQLNQPPHYKRDEIQKVLKILAGSENAHFAPADETTLRLVDRVGKVKWLSEDGTGAGEIARKFLGISLSRTDTSSNISVVDVAAVTEKPGVQTPSRKAEAEAEAEAEGEGEAHKDSPKAEGNRAQKEAPKPSRPKKPLPEVPRHRHGLPCPPPEPVANGSVGIVKKVPPKAPPPRRKGRGKPVTPASETTAPVPKSVS